MTKQRRNELKRMAARGSYGEMADAVMEMLAEIERLERLAQPTVNHTPGPWRIDHQKDYEPPEMGDCMIIENDVDDNADDARHIAFAFGDAGQAYADAHLICASPDLYAALAAIVRSEHKLPSGLWDKARAALDKADGKAPPPENP